ncbi:MAG TPA: hypothetical protein VGA58_11490, partial [bacterium]
MDLRLDGFAVQDGEDPSAYDFLFRDGGQSQFLFVKELERILDGVSVIGEQPLGGDLERPDAGALEAQNGGHSPPAPSVTLGGARRRR